MRSAIVTFRIRTAVGPQSVPGVVDRFGVAFKPEWILAINGSSILETLYFSGSGTANATSINTNFYQASDGAASYNGIADAPQFGTKITSGAGGTGPTAALASLQGDAFFGGNIYRACRVTSTYTGGFDIEVMTTTDWAYATDVMCLVLGSDSDLQIEISNPGPAGTYPTTMRARGLLNLQASIMSASGGIATGAGGGGGWGIGWDSPNGGPMSLHSLIGNQSDGNDSRYQTVNSYNSSASGTTLAAVDGHFISKWNTTSLTFTDSPLPGSYPGGGYLIGGTGVGTASASFIQKTTGTGLQTVNLGIHALALLVASNGAVPSTTIRTDWCESVIGFSNGVQRTSYWYGERALGQPVRGAGYISKVSILRFVSPTGPNGSGTTFTAVADLVEINPNGNVTFNWLVNDNVGRQIILFGIGAEPGTLPPSPPIGGGTTPALATGGLFFINPAKVTKHDSYYNGGELKIPNPTIRTALIGE